MNEGTYVSSGHIATVVGWLAVVGLMSTAWVVMIVDPAAWRYAGLLAASSCATSAWAAVLHIRANQVRVCNLIRSCTERLSTEPQRASVKALR